MSTGLPRSVDINVNITVRLAGPIAILQLGPAKKAILKVGGSWMPGTIDVDTTNETATLSFVDDKGNATPAPASAVVTFSSDNPAVATVTSDPNNPLVADITPVAPGSCNIGVTVAGAMEADGVTPIPNPDPVALTVNPGAAAGEQLVVGPS
jgi:hypothetical protein